MNRQDQETIDHILDHYQQLKTENEALRNKKGQLKINGPWSLTESFTSAIVDEELSEASLRNEMIEHDITRDQARVIRSIDNRHWDHRNQLKRHALKLFRDGIVHPNRGTRRSNINAMMWLTLVLIEAGIPIQIGYNRRTMDQKDDHIRLA